MFAFDTADHHFKSDSIASRQIPTASAQTPTTNKSRRDSRDDSWVSPGFAGGSPTHRGASLLKHRQNVGFEDALGVTEETAVADGADARIILSADQTSTVESSTPPVNIIPGRASIATVTNDQPADDLQSLRPEYTPNAVQVNGKTGRKKKRGMKKAAPAMATIRGFTPAASGDEDSDFSTTSTSNKLSPRFKHITSTASSPGLRPSSSCSQGGITALKLQLEILSLDSGSEQPPMHRSRSKLGRWTPSDASTTSETLSDGDPAEMTSYEVPLEHDFVSPDVGRKPLFGALEGGLVQDNPSRKMTAQDFEPLSCLGKGTFGTVLLVKHSSTGRLYAQKQFQKASLTVHKRLVEQTKTERVILESVNRHPFVVKLYYAFQDHEKLYLILEYAQGGELFTHLAMERMFTEEVAAFYMAEMVLALEHLHRNVGVVYRDLKPENCLLDSEGHLLLTDFGLSKVAISEDDHCKSILGTIEYMAPEVIMGNKYGMAVDWWSLGALGYDLLTGSPPFQGNNHAKIQEKILKQKLSLPYFLGPDAKDLLTRLLRKEPSKRLGGNMPKDIQAIKKHRFFRKIDWTALEKREVEPPIKPLITDPELAENFSKEFTDLAMSPVATHTEEGTWSTYSAASDTNPFGGFSFVASRSLLECGEGGF
ncbi:MAG: serine/threonine protein kinase psk1 [Pycnora praestabilis]|nr:MAG: serine/threonine protein kinase psk1 [Pycnora praestabilis]